MELPLAGIRVLDLSDELGAYCGRVLGALGAEVERATQSTGALARPPFDETGRSWWERFELQYKRDTGLALDTDEGRAGIADLASSCDVLIWSAIQGPSTPTWPFLDELLTGFEGITSIVTPFGRSGPYAQRPSSDLVNMALGGFLSLSGYPDYPVVPYGEQSYSAAALHAAYGTLVALYHQERTGEVQQVDVSAQEAIAHALENASQFYDLEGVVRGRVGGAQQEAGTGIFRCQDGFVYMMTSLFGSQLRWEELVEWVAEQDPSIGHELRHRRWGDDAWRQTDEAKAIFQELFERFAAEQSKARLYHEAQARGVNLSPLYTPADVTKDEQLRARGFFRRDQDDLTEIGPPFRLTVRASEAPRPTRRRGQANGAAALDDVSVLDFTWAGVGPFATKFLADFGADVVKIESTRRIDTLRTMRPMAQGTAGLNRSGYFANRNTSKRAITLDLKNPRGSELALQLAQHADIVINNFRPGALANVGLGLEAVSESNPAVVYVDMPMLGIEGPNAQYRGYGAMINALSGLYAMTGIEGRVPSGTGTNYPDHVPNPLHAACAMVAALIGRRRTHSGYHVEVSQLESSVNTLGPAVAMAANGGGGWSMAANGGAGWSPPANRSPEYCVQGVWRASDNGWVAITIRSAVQWHQLCDAWGQPDLGVPDADERELQVAKWVSQTSADEVVRLLTKFGAAAAKVLDAADAQADEQLRFRGHWITLDHPEMGRCVYDGPVARLSRTPGSLRSPAPLLGQHTAEVLEDWLEMEESHRAELEESGALE